MNKTKEHMQMYYVGEESANGEQLKEMRKQNLKFWKDVMLEDINACLLYTSPSPRDLSTSRMPSSA